MRELDVEIAEKVMGWAICPEDDSPDSWAEGYYGRSWHGVYVLGQEYPVSKTCAPYEWEKWSPSTEISDAWLVVEKMRGDSLFCVITCHDDGYVVEVIENNETHRRIYLGEAETAPLAICRAALEAVK